MLPARGSGTTRSRGRGEVWMDVNLIGGIAVAAVVAFLRGDLIRIEQDLGQREGAVTRRGTDLERLIAEQTARLEKVAGMSAEEARAQLLASIESEARAEGSRLVAEIRDNAQRNAEREARKVITLALQRYAGDHASQSSVSV